MLTPESTSPLRRSVERIALTAAALAFLVVTYFVHFHGRTEQTAVDAPLRDVLGVIIAAGLTLVMYSFLYRDNPLFKIAENLFVGVALGYQAIIVWKQSLRPEIVDPLFRAPTGEAFWSELAARAVPILLGVLLMTRVAKKHGWLSRYSYAVIVGWSAGLGIFLEADSRILRQLKAALTPLQKGVSAEAWNLEVFSGAWFNQVALPIVGEIVLLVGTVTVLFYFFFSVEHKRLGRATSKTGISFLMVAFGAMFGYTVMGRLALLIQRVDFLLRDWLDIAAAAQP